MLLLLGLRLDAFMIAADAVDRIAEPDRTIGSDNQVVRRVELLAVVLVGDDGDRAVEFGSGDPSATVFASEQASFPIDGVAVRVHRRLAVDADVTVVLRKAHDAVVGNVREQHVASCREVDRTLRPAEPGCDALDCHGAGEGREAGRSERDPFLFERLQAGIRIASPRKRAQRQRCLQGRRTRLAEGRDACRRSRLHRHCRSGKRGCACQHFAAVETAAFLFGIGKGQWSCHDFLPWFFVWEGDRVPAIRHKAGK